MTILSYQNVVKAYQRGPEEIRALDGVNLHIQAGEFVAIMGPSGCGKSTLLHVAGGIEPVTAGNVVYDGANLSGMRAPQLAALRRRELGYVFQSLNLIPSLTALENAALPLELDGVGHKVAHAEARERLARVGLKESLTRYPSEFSGGQQQRIAIARATLGNRRMILADEPTGALDSTTSDHIIELLADLAAAGTTVMLVTHEPRFASYADRVIYMRDGQLIDESRATDTPVGQTDDSTEGLGV